MPLGRLFTYDFRWMVGNILCSFPSQFHRSSSILRSLAFCKIVSFQSAQSLNPVQLFATPWTAAHQASLSITNSQSLLKVISIELVMPSNHFILCCPLLLLPSIFSSIKVFPVSQLFASGSQSIGASASASVVSMNFQD